MSLSLSSFVALLTSEPATRQRNRGGHASLASTNRKMKAQVGSNSSVLDVIICKCAKGDGGGGGGGGPAKYSNAESKGPKGRNSNSEPIEFPAPPFERHRRSSSSSSGKSKNKERRNRLDVVIDDTCTTTPASLVLIRLVGRYRRGEKGSIAALPKHGKRGVRAMGFVLVWECTTPVTLVAHQ